MSDLDENLPVVIENYSKKLKWVNGKPIVVGVPMSVAPMETRMKDLLMEAGNLPYDGGDPRYVGLSKMEAIVIDLIDQASLGDKDARKEVLDRALGKPMQNIKTLSVRGTIEDFLDSIDAPKQIETVDVTDEVPERSSWGEEADDI